MGSLRLDKEKKNEHETKKRMNVWNDGRKDEKKTDGEMKGKKVLKWCKKKGGKKVRKYVKRKGIVIDKNLTFWQFPLEGLSWPEANT